MMSTKSNDSTVNEYKERFVLPTPLQIMDIADNRKFPTPSTSPLDTSKETVEKPILRKKDTAKHSQPNNYKFSSEDGNNSNAAIARPKKPQRKNGHNI